MLALIDPQPVGLPGLYAMLAGFVLFLALLGLARRRGAESARPESQIRARASWIGVAIQMIGFVAVGFGPLRVMTTNSPATYAQATGVFALMLFTILMFLSASRAMGIPSRRGWCRPTARIGRPAASPQTISFTMLYSAMACLSLSAG